MTNAQDTRRTIHAGHTYINGIHWLRHCELRMRLMARADAIAKETNNADRLGD